LNKSSTFWFAGLLAVYDGGYVKKVKWYEVSKGQGRDVEAAVLCDGI